LSGFAVIGLLTPGFGCCLLFPARGLSRASRILDITTLLPPVGNNPDFEPKTATRAEDTEIVKQFTWNYLKP
jgi:hypothetical protein